MTDAPPDISIFIPSRLFDGFKFIPPVSNVTPLTDKNYRFVLLAPPEYSIIINLDSV